MVSYCNACDDSYCMIHTICLENDLAMFIELREPSASKHVVFVRDRVGIVFVTGVLFAATINVNAIGFSQHCV